MVDAIEDIGALHYTQSALKFVEGLRPVAGSLLTAFTVGISNNLVNNLPLGLVAGSTLATTHAQGLIANAVLIGVDLGPNLSVTGSLATILWLIALRKHNLDVSFMDFLRVGAIAMPAALLVTMAGALAMHAVFPTQ
jgi:arsenical pump membrane protein